MNACSPAVADSIFFSKNQRLCRTHNPVRDDHFTCKNDPLPRSDLTKFQLKACFQAILSQTIPFYLDSKMPGGLSDTVRGVWILKLA